MSNERLGTLYVVAAPSGAGKTTLVRQLLECLTDVSLSISHTTRRARIGERDGVHYHFTETEQFQNMVENQAFLEHAHVFGNFYGTSRREVESRLKHGTDVILEIDWQGAKQIRELIPETVSIYILPPSVEALYARLQARASDAPEIVAQRMHEAVDQIRHYKEFDYVVINDDFDIALSSLRAILMARRLRANIQSIRHANLIAEMLSGSI